MSERSLCALSLVLPPLPPVLPLFPLTLGLRDPELELVKGGTDADADEVELVLFVVACPVLDGMEEELRVLLHLRLEDKGAVGLGGNDRLGRGANGSGRCPVRLGWDDP